MYFINEKFIKSFLIIYYVINDVDYIEMAKNPNLMVATFFVHIIFNSQLQMKNLSSLSKICFKIFSVIYLRQI
jgi:hypothetical protein